MTSANFSEGNFQSVSKRHGLLTLCVLRKCRLKNEDRAPRHDITP